MTTAAARSHCTKLKKQKKIAALADNSVFMLYSTSVSLVMLDSDRRRQLNICRLETDAFVTSATLSAKHHDLFTWARWWCH